jgi:thiamine phosphate synthase YjbQ (UPF0047 family)
MVDHKVCQVFKDHKVSKVILVEDHKDPKVKKDLKDLKDHKVKQALRALL